MKFFRRAETVVRCAFRGTVLSVPDTERMLNSCPEAQRGRLGRRLKKIAADREVWSVHWEKARGDALRPHEVIARLRLNEIVVELASGQHGVLTELLVSEGECLEVGANLAKIGKPATALTRSQKISEMLAQFASRHHLDVERIKTLQIQLAETQQLVGQLRGEILSLRARQAADYLGGRHAPWSNDRKFKRLKQEFSKHFHPDTQAADDAERKRRERVFQEFWPIVERIERS